jgi:hypothetical protein
VPIVRESYDGLQTIGFSVLQGYVGLGYMTEILLSAVLGAIASATALYGAFQNTRGIRVHLYGALRVGLDRFLPLFAWRVSFVIMLLTIFFSATVPLQDDRLRQLWLVAMLLPILMLAMLGILVRWFLFEPVCVIERLDIFRSLKRSGVLTKGDRWRILGIGVLIAAGPAALQMNAMVYAAFGVGIGPVARFIVDSFSGASLLAFAVAYYYLRTSSAGAEPLPFLDSLRRRG